MKEKHKPDYWMPCLVKDLLSDTLHLDAAQFGSYWLMCCAYWMRRGPLPDDDCQLRTIARCPEQTWFRTKGVLQAFFDIENGLWRHDKIDKLLADAIENMRTASEKGKAGAAARWQKEQQPDSTGNAKAMPQPLPDVCPSTAPLPLPTTIPLSPPTPDVTRTQAVEEFVASVPCPETPNWEAVKVYADRIGLPEWRAQIWFNEMEGCGWTFKGKAVVKWQNVLSNVKSYWEADGRPKGPKSNATKGIAKNEPSRVELSMELDRVRERIRYIRDGAAQDAMGSKFYTEKEKSELSRLRTRRDDLKNKLGVVA